MSFSVSEFRPYVESPDGTFTVGLPVIAFPNQRYTEIGGSVPNTFEVGEVLQYDEDGFSTTATILGTYTVDADTFFHFLFASGEFTLDSTETGIPFPTSFSTSDPGYSASNVAFCFLSGTAIATPGGEVAVEALEIGDLIRTADGRDVAVKWIGHQTVVPVLDGQNMQPVRIAQGALGDGLPLRDLIVTADHGMVIDDLVINAGALVNGSGITWVPAADLAQTITFYHVETEAHDVILAEGAAAETFIDCAGRQAFDNYAEFVELYGSARIIPEMARPRVSSTRMLPADIRARLGLGQANVPAARPVLKTA